MNPMNELNRYIFEQAKNNQLNEDIASEILLKASQTGNEQNQEIAIIGIACRFAGAMNAAEYWNNLKNRKNCIGEFPFPRQKNLGIDSSQKSQFVNGGYFSEIDQFDAGFFKISPKEAMLMEPTQRVLLETAYQAIEDGGYGDISTLNPKTGVYIGVDSTTISQYRSLITENDFFATTGSVTGILAGRISYIFNLRGPNMVIDTACSSGLVAVHEACKALVNEECELAIAGGINIEIIPTKRFEQNEIVADDGVIRAFDKNAKGTVWGEGVGVLLLKPLPQALKDRDQVYAIIRGSVVNNDGASNGLTAPNADAQEELLHRAWEIARVNPETISYIEAHGTGTILGDPIEIKGINNAFKRYTTKKQFCGIGSVKSNIGHTVGASGIASLMKVVLALKNKEIPASINFEEPNPHIDFLNSPVYVMDHLQKWNSTNFPRRAGISAFGFSGTNCHVILEEAPPIEKNESNVQAPYYLLALSAKTREALLKKVQDMIEVFEKRAIGDLAQISYTLLKGRQHFNYRCALVVQDRTEAIQGLKRFERDEKSPNLFQGKVPRNFTGEKEKERYAQALLKQSQTMETNKSQYREIQIILADLYCKGYRIEWDKLFEGNIPCRISLPTYPFAKESYWIPERYWGLENDNKKRPVTSGFIKSYIHPLLHENTSNLLEQRYSSLFSGEELFFDDPIRNEQKILPGLAHLEMARAAIEMATGNLIENGVGMKLKNIEWARPVCIGKDSSWVHIGVYPEFNGEITYKVYQQGETDDTTEVVYSLGRAGMIENPENPIVDLKTLQTESYQQKLSDSEIYHLYGKMGFELKPEHQVIKQIYIRQDRVLAQLSLPSSIEGTTEEFVLHPIIMNAALQASTGLVTGNIERAISSRIPLPFALEEVEIYNRCTRNIWAILQHSTSRTASHKTQVIDIDLCDEQGNICVRLRGLETREEFEINPDNDSFMKTQELYEIMTFEEIWQEQVLPELSPVKLKSIICFLSNPKMQQEMIDIISTLEPQTKLIFIGQSTVYQKQTQQSYTISRDDRNTYEEAFRSIRADHGTIDAVLYLWTLEDLSFMNDYSSFIFILQAMANAELRINRILLAANLEKDSLESCYLESWIGFERSIGMILPNTQMAAVYQASGSNQTVIMRDWVQKLWAELRIPKARSVLYQDKKRLIYQIRPMNLPTGNSLLKAGGTYLITGGCGGLGFQFSKYIAQKHPVNLILIGRSTIDSSRQKKIEVLEKLGTQVMYLQTDVCNINTMRASLKKARERFGQINGVIHAAGIDSAQSILKKEPADFQKVINPKIKGTQVLDKVLKEDALDFICYFSSSSAILGDFGTCDYAVGNRFQMAYAHYRNRQTAQGRLHGKAIAINWPLWKDGGMGVDDIENTQMYLKTSGQRLLETAEGMGVFERILGENSAQTLVIVGKPSRVNRFLGLSEVDPVTSFHKTLSLNQRRRVEMKGLSIEQCLEWDLKEQISNLIKISRDKIERDENLADLGFDSINLAQLASQLTKYFGIEINPALFFGYSTLEKLSQYFLTAHREIIYQFYHDTDEEITVSPTISPLPIIKNKQARFLMNTPAKLQEPIAIIGMSGRFPGARNIEEMWRILAAGEDMVKEIPLERFDWRQYYGDPNIEPGKTNCKWCGCIPGVSEFDPLFFEISPREAETMDPRQRLLLEESWKALEDAGYGAQQLKTQKIGMFVGAEEGDYQLLTKTEGSITANHNAILASRLAYFLNLNGPVMAINTACSSGLVAAHQGILSLYNGECDAAIIAGVNLMLTPDSFIGMSQAGMLSGDGKCFAFDKRANGMVPGEAVAVIVCKRLSQAEADGDPIYAVIRGSGINYDGKTNGITAPSGISQTGLLKMVYDQYRINPEEIEYIVTHGTGTKLGDPVEINALYNAFKDCTSRYSGARPNAPKQGYCALTSTKTNFGHTFAASGLVSLISLVQALRHEMIPASLHCEQENDYINWKESPFFVNKTNKPWPAAAGVAFSEGVAISTANKISGSRVRMGGISAFGMSGTNVHMIVESYSRTEANFPEKQPFYLLALSAKTRESLLEKVKDLIKVFESETSVDLWQISYTLLEGRQHFNHRCAIVVQEREDAIHGLKQVESTEKIPNLFQGKVSRDFTGQKVIAQYAQELLQQSRTLKENKSKYQEILFALADLYCQGYEMDWNILYSGDKPQRVNLPTYPFAKEHYWVPVVEAIGHSPLRSGAFIHPLLQQNTSDLSEQRYSSIFTGQEFFLKDHVVMGQKVLPGVAYLEMARAAVEAATNTTTFVTDAAGNRVEDRQVLKLKNVVWARPIGVGAEPVQVHIGLYPEENDGIAYEVYNIVEPGEAGEVVYSQGYAALAEVKENPVLDLRVLQAECSQRSLSAGEVYEFYKTIGLNYGPGHQGIERIYVGNGRVLAKLSIPASVAETAERFILHPSIMDGALQAAIGMEAEDTGKIALKPSLPFALEELEVYHRCTGSMWALLQHSNGNRLADKISKLDIDLCDEQGKICIRMKGFSTRVLEGEIGETYSASTIGRVLLEPVWNEQTVSSPIGNSRAQASVYTQHIVILCEPGEISPDSIENGLNGVRVFSLQSKQKEIAKRFENYALKVFEEVQKILETKPAGQVLIQIVFSNQGERQLLAGLSGFLKTAQLENPKITGQLIEVETMEDPAELIAKLMENSLRPMDSMIRYQKGARQVSGLGEVKVNEALTSRARVPWKDGGVYLITGGAGGLGRIFAKEITSQTQGAILVLTGRSSLDEHQQADLKELERNEARVTYRPVDVTDRKAVNELIRNIGAEFGKLDGIIHSAGVIRDNYIIKKSKEEFIAVLGPKVAGLVNLDMATKDLNLDFVILFASTSGSLGNPGQTDYATANAFMDAYAKYRNTLVSSGQRRGRTLSVNWPLWQEGGMRVDETVEKLMKQSIGMTTMRTETGIRALYEGIASGRDQVLVIEGDPRQIRDALLRQPATGEEINSSSSQTNSGSTLVVPQELLQEKTINYLKKLLSPVIKLPVERIEADTSMDKYGIDSIMVMDLTNQLEKTFGSLSKTLFFEYQTIRELGGYFLENYHEKLNGLIGIGIKDEAPTDTGTLTQTQPIIPVVRSHKGTRFAGLQFMDQVGKPNRLLDIAIIGVSGRYPQARNLDEFWKNLRDGKDCITEIPKDRWDHSRYYDEDKNNPGKTYSKWGGFLEGVDQFDPLFFSISPLEAESMDPQERLFLECVYETLEDAGYTRETLSKYQSLGLERNIGVYVGVMYEEYQLYGAQAQAQGFPIALLGNPSSIANRVSYFCNFHGPSVAIDTMCSSSLTAIHMACQSIQHNGCELAIAGGVNVSIHPNKYLALAQGRFVSSKGRCESFGLGGDGYVPGEGVGAVLLKPLSKAIIDGDHIYGVIKGTAINHGGKTNGYTVPNPNAQALVVGQALQEAGIDPRTISYIEAHGTGTSLGDPIEITGLVKAFQKYTENKQFCAIGSAKSNIGHCESAAGIAGMTKVLLQLKNRQIAPSLHSEVLNPNIDFINTPFIVQQELKEWKRPVVTIEGVTKEYPRIAGISSFGAGGSNAHVVIEEYTGEEQEQSLLKVTSHNPAIIVLSAKNEEQLQEKAQQLLSFIREQQFPTSRLADIAYTLQVGREAMEERLGLIVGSIRELDEKLQSLLEGQEGIPDLHRGQVAGNRETLHVFTADEDLQKALDAWISKGKYEKLLDLWVKGLIFDWNKLYGEERPRRISLPTYPFAREKYWISEIYTNLAGKDLTTGFLNPLLHQNTSDIYGLQFSSSFTGKEFFLRDHVIKGQRVLPGVACLEMARAAIMEATGADKQPGIRLRNIVWARPLVIGEQPVRVNIGLYPGDNGEITYEIYSEKEEEPVIYSQGSGELIEVKDMAVIDLKALQVRSTGMFSNATVYETYKEMGIEYGPGYRGIEELYIGEREVLAKISLPGSVSGIENQFGLHPSIMDSALQTSIGFMMGTGGLKKLSLPFALEELEMFGECTSTMWALVRFSAGSKPGDSVEKLDIDICDEQGRVCIGIKGYSSRALGERDQVGLSAKTGMLMFEASWEEKAVPDTSMMKYDRHLVILCEMEEIPGEKLESQLNRVRCLSLQSKQNGIDRRFQSYAVQVFEEIKSLLLERNLGKILVQIIVLSQGEQHIFSGLTGILRTAQLENPRLIGQLIEVDREENIAGIIKKVKENSQSPADSRVRYQKEKRMVAGWREVKRLPEGDIPWKDKGVYLITGGAGGLGLIFAKEIVSRIKDGTVILTGRSLLSEAEEIRLREIRDLGSSLEYRQMDVTDMNAVTELIQSVRKEYGELNGIIHSAGIIRDNYIIKKTKEELLSVTAPKVSGVVNLDQATKDQALDFIILFSSLAGSIGNPGQADYSAGNAFMDAYAQYRNGLVNSGQRRGWTLAINWPLWKNGGMRIDPETEKLMTENTGMVAMETGTGIQALYQGLASGKDQVMVVEGNPDQIRMMLLKERESSKIPITGINALPAIHEDWLQEKALNYFKQEVSSIIKLPVNRIEADAAMEKYGIDSVLVMQLTNQFEKSFGSLSKTLFYEFQTLQEITRYFMEAHHERLTELLGLKKETAAVDETISESLKGVPSKRWHHRYTPIRPESFRKEETGAFDIAIIGVSGRYPQAKNIYEFWNNLRDGKDCITEIPLERWDHSLYFDEDKNKPGKSYSKWGGFIDGVDQFDPLFFNISPGEAEIMDPQERLFLECVYETMEDAGYTRETLGKYQGLGLEGNVGVYVGVMYEEYQLYGAQEQIQGRPIALGGSPSSIANRVSYFYNFHGPSVAIDTMCSSSLTAIHMACHSIQRGECELAIAGGVNVTIHPNKYLLLCQDKFASTKGRCESFGRDGDGYVPGEGVGAVLLKPLSKAIADDDHIYGVIKGTAINHGGKTNGYTVPNPNAQANVIGQSLQVAGVDPRTISYIEAHGTGTVLGDPIEITGLVKTFQKYTQDNRFCAIGSVKSNIGHCESASGIAGLTKILMQLKNNQIVPSLHSKELNLNIDFNNTPFIVQQELTEWKRPVITIDGVTKEYPRIAGISSFGAGGSNAHVIIEEYAPQQRRRPTVTISSQNPALIVLSAKDGERLKEQVERLSMAIEEQQFSDGDLANIAYTLQVGRETLEERLGVITSTIQELNGKLKDFLAGRNHIEDLYYEYGKRNKEALTVVSADEDMQKTIETWISKGKYAKILDLWVKGMDFSWDRLYGEVKPHRISLPTYPFAKEHYWVPVIDVEGKVVLSKGNVTYIHPLLQQNTSNFTEQRYSSTFTGKEFFLADHRVNGQKILPGVAYLEMVRAAVMDAAGISPEDRKTVKVKNLIWARPVVVNEEAVQVQIGLYPGENGEITFEVYSLGETDKPDEIIYSQGNAMLVEAVESPVLDLKALQAKCGQPKVLKKEIYNILKDNGHDYGPGHQGIESISVIQGLVLAQLSLPASVVGTKEEYVLHPSVMDSALQASIAITAEETDKTAASKVYLPFALQELEIYRPCTQCMWAVIQYSKGCTANDTIQKLDINLCDEHGNVCVSMKGYSSRVLEGNLGSLNPEATIERIILEPVWKDREVSKVREETKAPEFAGRFVILCEPGEISPIAIEARINGARCLCLEPKEKSITERYQNYVIRIFEEIQKIFVDKPKGEILIQLVIFGQDEQQLLAGLSGMLKSIQMENPKVIGQVIEIEAMEDTEGLIAKITENSRQPLDSRIRYHEGKRQLAEWAEIKVSPEKLEIPWKDGGVYLITGGAGGLGRIFAKEITERVKNTNLVLTGRSSLDENKQAKLKELEANGTKVTYRSVDVSIGTAVDELIRNIINEFGKLDGIIHSAGLIRDNYIIKKTKAEVIEVLAPKLSGLVNLDQATKNLNLDFIILFSSMAGSVGNPGQADYSAANAFMDAYACYRNKLVALNQRHGKTLAINWPYWKEGGIRLDENIERMMRLTTGMVAMNTQTGIWALYQGMIFGKDQVMVAEGDIQQIKSSFTEQPAQTGSTNPSSSKPTREIVNVDQEVLMEKTSNLLKKLISPVFRLRVERMDTDTPLEKYGLNSILVMQMNIQLEKKFGSLSKTLFYEYKTIRELSCYFLESYREKLNQLLGIEIQEDITPMDTVIISEPEIPGISKQKRLRFAALQPTQESKTNEALDIAIIGISGRYPQARKLQEFWQNLCNGKDCIVEIPKERWDYRQFYDEDKNKPDKLYTKWGGFIDGVDQFDPLFFNISPQEAEFMEPQERLFLECVYETLEDAGYTRETLAKYQGLGLEGNIGVFVGVLYEEYQLYGAQAQVLGHPLVLSGSVSSIANRVSYFCNFHGPSMALDTMCSSSLTAIHMACQSIKHGGCELAIAGGVNLSIHPNKYLMLSQGKFLSSNGLCQSFGSGGDGYIPGEGIGAILLKPLSKAIDDGDHIYGVIKGTAINHGGKTSGYSVPNPNAQAAVIGQALQEARIDPRTISYIEAHGTGTALGDPIEITGLVKAFQKYTNEQQFCAIGSVKSNIGHSESAAGIAGVTKVILQLKNRQIVPSLHSEVLNPNIDFSNTPFVVQQKLTEWKRPVIEIHGEKKEYPRRAGISSFGGGGANAHVIIEEYIPGNQEKASIRVNSQNPAIIVLSAKNQERLKEQVQQILTVIKERQLTDTDLANLAYTLQVGREAMEERLGVIAGSTEDLAGKLAAYLAGEDGIEDLLNGQVKRSQDAMTILTADEEMQEAIKKWIERKKYRKLLELWVKGLVLDWSWVYGETKPRRISLPTYPFARERYWVPEFDDSEIVAADTNVTNIHPLLHQNMSDLLEQKYSSTFTGKEFFLADHIVNGQKVLPGVAYLEMARAAVEAAAGNMAGDRKVIRLKNVVWAKPVIMDSQPLQLLISLYLEDGGGITFEIYRKPGIVEAEADIYCQGDAELIENKEAPVIDLKSRQAICNQWELSGAEVYQIYKSIGIEYGPGYQAIETVYVGQGMILAKLSLPTSVTNTKEQFVLHPCIINATLQASIGMATGAADRMITPKLFLPFTLQELEVYNQCTGITWVMLQYGKDGGTADTVRKFDVELCDERGEVCARMKGFSSKTLERVKEGTGVATALGNMMYKKEWQEQAAQTSLQAIFPEVQTQSGQALIATMDLEVLKEKTLARLKTIFGAITKLNADRFDLDEPLENYGIGSVMIIQLNQKLAEHFGELSTTLFYEYQTLRALLNHLIEEYPQECVKWTGLGQQIQIPVEGSLPND